MVKPGPPVLLMCSVFIFLSAGSACWKVLVASTLWQQVIGRVTLLALTARRVFILDADYGSMASRQHSCSIWSAGHRLLLRLVKKIFLRRQLALR